jgi:hypothetical protein
VPEFSIGFWEYFSPFHLYAHDSPFLKSLEAVTALLTNNQHSTGSKQPSAALLPARFCRNRPVELLALLQVKQEAAAV